MAKLVLVASDASELIYVASSMGFHIGIVRWLQSDAVFGKYSGMHTICDALVASYSQYFSCLQPTPLL